MHLLIITCILVSLFPFVLIICALTLICQWDWRWKLVTWLYLHVFTCKCSLICIIFFLNKLNWNLQLLFKAIWKWIHLFRSAVFSLNTLSHVSSASFIFLELLSSLKHRLSVQSSSLWFPPPTHKLVVLASDHSKWLDV